MTLTGHLIRYTFCFNIMTGRLNTCGFQLQWILPATRGGRPPRMAQIRGWTTHSNRQHAVVQ